MRNEGVIRTPRLVLEPFDVQRHLTPRYVSWLNDPRVVRYSEQRHVSHTTASCRQYVDSFRGTASCLWAIQVKDEGLAHIGNLAAYVDEPNRLAELAILIGESSHGGKGFGTEAWSGAIGHLFQASQVRKVHAGTMAENVPMLKIFEKTGMAIESRRSRHYLLEGREMDLVCAAIFRPAG
jgi:RimJ/RimL family protein N-acetyltransferase